MSHIKNHLGLICLFFIFLLLCLFHPTYFMADDWERIYAHYTHNESNYLHHLYLRFFLHGFCIDHFFPVFLQSSGQTLFGGKVLLWGSLVLAALLYLKAFFKDFDFFKSPWTALIPLVIAFNPNNHEWNFFPILMTLHPVILLMSLCFFLSHRGEMTFWKILLNSLGITAGFYSYESLLPFAILVEIGFFLYAYDQREREEEGENNKDHFDLQQSLKYISYFVIPAIVLTTFLKILTHQHHMEVNGHVQSFAAKWGFKPSLFEQMVHMTLNHDYYKIRWGTGISSFIGILLLLIARFKTASLRTILKKDVLVILCYLIATSYYYLIMDYSARRALGGPLFFSWAYIFLCYISLRQSPILGRKFKHLLSFFIIVPFLVHHAYIISIKGNDRKIYFENAKEIRNKVKDQGAATVVEVELDEAAKGLKSWQLVNPIQLHGFLVHHLGEENYKKILPFKKQFPNYRYIHDIK